MTLATKRRVCAGCGHLEGIHGPKCSWPKCACVHFHSIPTAREMQVLKALARGKSTKEIAAELGTSPKTVTVQKTALYRSLGVNNAMHAVGAAAKSGLLKPSDLPDFR